jgi:DNA-binding transcriptional ArsR family regulator
VPKPACEVGYGFGRRLGSVPSDQAEHQRDAGDAGGATGGDDAGTGRNSVFVWPDVVSGFAHPWQPTIIYPARGMGSLRQPPEPTDALVRLLGPNRAAILTALDEPASTTTIAERHGLAPSSVSAHLSVLRDAGLLTSARHRHHILYQRTPLGLALTEPTESG